MNRSLASMLGSGVFAKYGILINFYWCLYGGIGDLEKSKNCVRTTILVGHLYSYNPTLYLRAGQGLPYLQNPDAACVTCSRC